MSKAWFALAVIALVLLAVLGRYEIVPATHDDRAVVLKLDRWTGRTEFWAKIGLGVGNFSFGWVPSTIADFSPAPSSTGE